MHRVGNGLRLMRGPLDHVNFESGYGPGLKELRPDLGLYVEPICFLGWAQVYPWPGPGSARARAWPKMELEFRLRLIYSSMLLFGKNDDREVKDKLEWF